MKPRKFAIDPVHYIHLADPSEEGIGNLEEPKITTLSNEDTLLATTLTSMASRGLITNEECAQLAKLVTD